MAVSKAVEHGANAVICASTGNTSASAAAYAAHAGHQAAVLVPEGKIAMGKLTQALVHGAAVRVDGNFDDACGRAGAGRAHPVPGQLGERVPHRRPEDGGVRGLSTRSATRPTSSASRSATPATTPRTGSASRTTASRARPPVPRSSASRPRLGAAGRGAPVDGPETVATAIRIGNPACGSCPGREREPRRRWARSRPADPRGPPHARRPGGDLRRARLGGLCRRSDETLRRGRPPRRGGRSSRSPATA